MANNSSYIGPDTPDQTKKIWLDCQDYQHLVKLQLQYLRNELPYSPTYYTIKTSKQRECIIAFAPKEYFTNIVQSVTNSDRIKHSIHLCIYDGFGNVFYCSHDKHLETCSIIVSENEHLDSETNHKSWIVNQLMDGTALLNHFLQNLEDGLRSELYKFMLENYYYITAVDLEFGRKDSLLPILEQLLNKTDQETNRLDSETLEALRLQNPAQILRNLYLSSQTPAKNLTLLKQLNINYILNLTGFNPTTNELRFKFDYPPEFTILHIKIADEMDVNISDHFDAVLHFIDNSIGNNNSNRILIHCDAGISRSATIVIAYLMQYHNKSLKSAYDFVKQRKTNIDPNINFFKQLMQFEKQIYSNNNFQPSFSLHEYLVQYMIKGPAAAFTHDQILSALEKTNNDTHAACSLLFSIM